MLLSIGDEKLPVEHIRMQNYSIDMTIRDIKITCIKINLAHERKIN